MFYFLFGWEMRHLHTEGSCPVVSGQGVCDYDQYWSLAGRVAQCCGSYAQFFVLLCNLILHIDFNFYKPQQKIHIHLFVMKYSGLATLDQGWQLLKVVRPGV